MINYHKNVVSVLNKILPTYYELGQTKDIELPAITYMEIDNIQGQTGDTLIYSEVYFQVTVWSATVQEMQENSIKIDKAMREEGFIRTSAHELFDNENTIKRKVLTYKAIALEK